MTSFGEKTDSGRSNNELETYTSFVVCPKIVSYFRINRNCDFLTYTKPGDPHLWKETQRIFNPPPINPPLRNSAGYYAMTDLDKDETLADHLKTDYTPTNIKGPQTLEEVHEFGNADHHSSEWPVKFILLSEIKRLIKKLQGPTRF